MKEGKFITNPDGSTTFTIDDEPYASGKEKKIPKGKPEQTKTVTLDLEDGNQNIVPDEGKVLSEVEILKPNTLLPENIKKDIDIAGVVGTLNQGLGTGQYFVRVYDYDGTLLDERYLSTGDTYELPTPPIHDKLTFDYWISSEDIINNTITISNSDVMIGPIYHPTSGYTEYDINVGPKYTVEIQNYSGLVNWGDGTEDSNSSHIYSQGGNYTVTFKSSITTLPNLFVNKLIIEKVRLSQDITSMNTGLFQATYIQSIVISHGITSLGNNVFNSTYCLKCIIIPNSVTNLTQNLCYNNPSIKTVIIGSGITEINNSAFYGCSVLYDIFIGKNTTEISANGFYNCVSLNNIVFNKNKLIKLSNYAFYQCYLLNKIDISNITSIYTQVFYGCRVIDNLIINNAITVFNANLFLGCYSLKNLTLPNSLTRLWQYALSATSIKSIFIPKTLNQIDQGALSIPLCSLFDFSNHESIPTIQNNAFPNITNYPDYKIVVPDSLYDSWIIETNWSNYASHIVKASQYNA